MDVYDLITRNLQETIGFVRDSTTEPPSIYWGTAPTGKPHIGYFVPILKIADFLRAGCNVTILIADLHAYLDNGSTVSWEVISARSAYYELVILAMLSVVPDTPGQLRFVKGSDFQLTREYTLDVYRALALTSEHSAKKAGAEVVKQSDNAKLSGIVYPILQALDEQYLGVDAQFGGVDQRKIFTFAQDLLPSLGYEKRAHLMNPMLAGLTGGKMSASVADSKIDLLDQPKDLARKVNSAFCEPRNIENAPLLQLLKHIIFPTLDTFHVKRPQKYGGDVIFHSYSEVEAAFSDGNLHPADLKSGVIDALSCLLNRLRALLIDEKFSRLSEAAY